MLDNPRSFDFFALDANELQPAGAALSETYHVRIANRRHTFCAAHFITYNGDVCEPLHGHNYQVAADISAPLDENKYVVDFVAVRESLQTIVDGLDHRVILPTEHRSIRVTEQQHEHGDEVAVTYGSRRWIFPRGDCVLLPVANTTAELLARHIARELLSALAKKSGFRPQKLRISVDECDVQIGIYETSDD